MKSGLVYLVERSCRKVSWLLYVCKPCDSGLEPFSPLCQPHSAPCPSVLRSCLDKAELSVLVWGLDVGGLV